MQGGARAVLGRFVANARGQNDGSGMPRGANWRNL